MHEEWFGRANEVYASQHIRGETDIATQSVEISLKVSFRNSGYTECGTPVLGGRDQGGLPGEHVGSIFFQEKVVALKKENLVLLEGENSVPSLLTR